MTHPTDCSSGLGETRNLIFTEYVRSLNPGSQPDNDLFNRVWSSLEGALRAEMRRRSLLQVSPSCFGFSGYQYWTEDAFEELVCDCYTFIFIERLAALKAQLQIKENIEGLAFRNIQNFLHDLQKKHDPVGYRTYQVMRRAVAARIEDGTLNILDGSPRLGADSVLGFGPAPEATKLASEGDLMPIVRRWCDLLAINVVTARGRRQRQEVVATLALHLTDLACPTVRIFRFRDLVALAKSGIRARWHALGGMLEGETALEKAGGEGLRRVRVVRPGRDFEARDTFDKLDAHVSGQIHRQPSRFRGEAKRLWDYLRREALESGREKPPSQRQVAKRLGFSRHQVSRHFSSLRRWVNQFQATG